MLDSSFLPPSGVMHKSCIFNYFNASAHRSILNRVIYSLNEVQRLPVF
nr:MAG TPA: hypothetical protein [Caudoviricetes sp.]